MIRIPICGVGVRAPGISNWKDLITHPDYRLPDVPVTDQPKGIGDCLPATERRRATPVTRLALDLAMEATAELKDKRDICSVFGSSGGEVTVVHEIFSMLAAGDTALSPTAFHNSVHNAAAGYWSIASGSMQPADSLCAFDDSFGASLAECCLRFAEGQRNLLLVAYDIPPPYPIFMQRSIPNVSGGALLLAAKDIDPMGWLHIRYRSSTLAKPSPVPKEQSIAQPNALLMTLLLAIAQKNTQDLTIPTGFGGVLEVQIIPCD